MGLSRNSRDTRTKSVHDIAGYFAHQNSRVASESRCASCHSIMARSNRRAPQVFGPLTFRMGGVLEKFINFKGVTLHYLIVIGQPIPK